MSETLKATVDPRLALAWAHLPGLTPRRFWRAVRELGSVEALLSSNAEALQPYFRSEALARAVLRPTEAVDGDRLLEAARRAGTEIVTAFDPRYASALREIPDPPIALYATGRLERMQLPAVAVVGARRASRYGRDAASRLASDLSASGIVVVSGLARGIDGAAHAAALEGAAGTLAVLGSGLDVDYPPENRELRRRIAAEGLLLTEYPPGTLPRAEYFPVRNRIIAGLSAATVVVEAAERSGSLITARLATDFGRDVFAVPGSIFQEGSSGTHALLREGAILCRGVEDILSELFPALSCSARAAALQSAGLSEQALSVLARLRAEEESYPDDLAESLGCEAAEVLAVLFELELAGLVRALPGGRYAAVR